MSSEEQIVEATGAPTRTRWMRGQDEILAQVADHGCTRDDIISVYAAAIRYDSPVDWPKVNAAIMERWSKSGLNYIKQRAWKALSAPPASVPSPPEPAGEVETAAEADVSCRAAWGKHLIEDGRCVRCGTAEQSSPGQAALPDPPCASCGMTSQVEPSRTEPGRFTCHGCAQTFAPEEET